MPYEPATTKLNRRLVRIILWISLFPIGLLALLATSMGLRQHLALRDHLPSALEPGYFHQGGEGMPMGLARFSISRSAAGAIGAEGTAFLERTSGPGWRPTPLPLEPFIWRWADCSTFWCSGSDVAKEATEWVSRPGSYVLPSSNTNNDTVIVVNPAERALIFGYYLD